MKNILNENLSNNEIVSGNFSENKLVNFDVDFNGLEKSVGIFFPSVRNAMVERFRAETFYKIGFKAQDIINHLGIEAKPIPPKAALPLFEKMSLEHEEEMYDMWAKLLVASTNEYNPIQIQYADILSQIGNKEAKLLKDIYKLQIKEDYRGYDLETTYKEALKKYEMTEILRRGLIQSMSHEVEKQRSFEFSFPYSKEIDGNEYNIVSNSFRQAISLLKQLNLINYEIEIKKEKPMTLIQTTILKCFLTNWGYEFVMTLEGRNINEVKND